MKPANELPQTLTYSQVLALTPADLRELVRRLPDNASEIWELRKKHLADTRNAQQEKK